MAALAAPLLLQGPGLGDPVAKLNHFGAENLYTSVGGSRAPAFSHVGSATFISSMSNLVLAVLGAGQLTLPYVLSQLGLVSGLAAIAAFALLSAHSLHTLSVHELHFTPNPTDCLESYSELVVRVLGKPGQTLCSVLLALYAWGGALSFMIILKGELAYLWALAVGMPVPGSVLLTGVAAGFIWPLSSLQDLSLLKKMSPLGCAAAVLVTCVVLMCTRWTPTWPVGAQVCQGPRGGHLPQSSAGALQLWPASLMGVAAALPLVSFALNASWAYVPILCTMRGKTRGRVTGLIGGALAVITANYLLISVYGYAMFCGATQPNVLDSLAAAAGPGSPEAQLVVLARSSLALQLTLALPMRFFVARRAAVGDGPGPRGRLLLSGALVAAAACLASLPLSLATVLGITSSVCASMIIYILPAAVDLRTQLPGRARKAVSLVSLATGMFLLVGGLVANLTGAAVGGG